MRLIHAKTLQLEEFSGSNIPPYAILSHTWGADEVSYQDMQIHDVEKKLGYQKIKYSCDQALNDDLNYVWVDTCCIDKTSSSVLSEAINSMFRWYRDAQVCYAYLSDVSTIDDPEAIGSSFRHSRWFTRGWTLQELIAPDTLRFYTKDWDDIGTKEELCETIEKVTGIGSGFLCGQDLRFASIAKRMSWASMRKTTREEDLAYCLLGIFGINMPMIYGEGNRAFIRLQEEIMRESDDQTIFAWGPHSKRLVLAWSDPDLGDELTVDTVGPKAKDSRARMSGKRTPDQTSEVNRGALATSPAHFSMSGNVISCYNPDGNDPHTMTSRGIRINLHICSEPQYALLDCHLESDFQHYLAIPLKSVAPGEIEFARSSEALLLVPVARRRSLPVKTVYLKKNADPTSYNRQSRRNKILLQNWDRKSGMFPSRVWGKYHAASLGTVYPLNCLNKTQAILSPAQWRRNKDIYRAVVLIRLDDGEATILIHQETLSAGNDTLVSWCHLAFRPDGMSLDEIWNQEPPQKPNTALKLPGIQTSALMGRASFGDSLILTANLEKSTVMGEEMFLITVQVVLDTVDVVRRGLGNGPNSITPKDLVGFPVPRLM